MLKIILIIYGLMIGGIFWLLAVLVDRFDEIDRDLARAGSSLLSARHDISKLIARINKLEKEK